MDQPTVDSATQRSAEILDSVKSVFALKGFDGASMQDLALAAQMSVGNFYRYFPSKNAIITALVERDMREIEETFQAVRIAEDRQSVFVQKLRERIEKLPIEDAALWTEMQAASFRVPEIAALKRAMEATVVGNVVSALALIHGGGDDPEMMERYATRAHFLMLMIHGYAQCKYCSHDKADTSQTVALGELLLSAIEQTLFAPDSNPKS